MTSRELAEKAKLNERYVREWLGGLSVAGVLIHEPDTMTYHLPHDHAALLSSHGEVNLAVFAQYLPLLAIVEDDVLRCFRDGGRVPYECYRRFHEVMAEDSGQTVLSALFDAILPLAGGLVDRLEESIDVLDLGCGRGLALMKMATRYPASRISGYDLSYEAIDWANARAREENLDNVIFEQRDLSDFDQTADAATYDFATTFDAIHD